MAKSKARKAIRPKRSTAPRRRKSSKKKVNRPKSKRVLRPRKKALKPNKAPPRKRKALIPQSAALEEVPYAPVAGRQPRDCQIPDPPTDLQRKMIGWLKQALKNIAAEANSVHMRFPAPACTLGNFMQLVDEFCDEFGKYLNLRRFQPNMNPTKVLNVAKTDYVSCIITCFLDEAKNDLLPGVPPWG